MQNQKMLSRRKLIKLATTSALVGNGMLLTSQATATQADSAQCDNQASGIEGSLYLTKHNSGRWAGKENSHLPLIKVEKNRNNHVINVHTPHEVSGFDHYIVKHLLLDKDFNILGEKMFDPKKEFEAKSTFEISGERYHGKLYALSVCNKHDAWLASITL